MSASPILQTTQATPAPDVVDFGVGMPGLALLPLQYLQQAAVQQFAQADPAFLQYGAEAGDGYLRVALADFLSQQYGFPVNYEQLFMTNGVSQALDLLSTLYTQPGDTIFVEEPSYMYVFGIFRDHRLKIVSLPTDRDGLIVEALEEALRRQRPAFLYTIPTFQNPTGTVLTAQRRARLAELSHTYEFFVFADEVYQCLHFGGQPPLPMAAYSEQERVISLGSFSKILAPGLRLGWIQTSPTMVKQLAACGLLDSGGGLNPFTSALVRHMLTEGWQNAYLTQLRTTYQARAQRLGQALRELIGEWATFSQPYGGIFLWLALDRAINAPQLLTTAERYKVSFKTGDQFSSERALKNYLRLSYAYYDTPRLLEGAERLREALLALLGR